MSVLPVGFGSAAGGTPAGAVERSLRFNSADNAFLNRTPASAGNRKTWTWSGWVKRSKLGAQQGLIGCPVGTSDSTFMNLQFNPSDQLGLGLYTQYVLLTTQVFRDTSAWYHIVVSFDTTNATANNRCRMYVNGVEITTFTSRSNPTLNADYGINAASQHDIGRSEYTNSTCLGGYLTEINFIDSPALVGSTTNASTTVTLTTGTTANIGVGWNVGGTNIPSGATVSSITNSTQFVISAAATATGSSISIGVAPPVTAFGETDSATGVWKPKAYTGTYGTNGFYLPFKTASQWSGYFDGSNDYLSVASNAAWQYGTGDFTVECWLLGTSSGALSNQYPLGRYNTSAGAYGALQIGNSTNIYWYYGNGAAYTFTLGTALTTNRWYHFAVSRSGTSLRFFLDGTQIGSTQTDSTNYSGTAEFRIINAHQSSATYFPGYISNVRVVKGSAVYTANFTPSTQSLTAITNTVLLTCQSSTFIDNSTNNFTITNNGGVITQQFSPFTLDVTDDHSGQGNHWQPNNLDLRTTGAGADILVDSPTSYGTDSGLGAEVRGNYATLNPLKRFTANATLSNGNLTASDGSTTSTSTIATMSLPASGKWYWEITVSASVSGGIFIGACPEANAYGTAVVQTNGSYRNNGTIYNTASVTQTSGATYTTNDVIGVAVDVDNGTVQFYKNGTAQGATPSFSFTALSVLVPFIATDNAVGTKTVDCNFGQRAFAYTAPSGFKALCTQNLPPVTIGATSMTQANKYMDVTLYTGNATARSITNSGSMQPDFVWDKLRSGANSHRLFDAVRGVEKALYSNLTNIEATETGTLTAFNSNGFSLGTNNETNTNGSTYVAWQWNAGGSNQTISVGQYATSPANVPSIASTVRANTTSGFSIVTYTGNGTNGATVGHGLGTTPAMVIIKSRSLTGTTPSASWIVWHRSISQAIQTDTTIALTGFTGATVLNSTAQSTTYGFDAQVNGSTQTYVAYCFAPVAGYSAFGTYTGNNSTDGPFIYLGFRPKFWMVKRTDSTGDWYIYDSSRSPYNAGIETLAPSQNFGESSFGSLNYFDLLSNGMKIRQNSTNGFANVLNATYIYAAFAESPFKYSLAR